jgi:hypothetical protein
LGKDGGEEAVIVDSHELAAAPVWAARSPIANNPIRVPILTRLAGKKKHADVAACFSQIN